MKAYAEQAGIVVAALYTWKATLQARGLWGELNMHKLVAVQPPRAGGHRCQVLLPSRVVLEVAEGYPAEQMAGMVQTPIGRG